MCSKEIGTATQVNEKFPVPGHSLISPDERRAFSRARLRCFRKRYTRQNARVKSVKTVKISKRPISIAKVQIASCGSVSAA